MKPHLPWIAGLLAGLAATWAAADHIPSATGTIEFEARSALQLDLGRFDPLVEIRGAVEGVDHEFRYRAATVGAYYRLHKNLKAGAFYRLQQGARHDDDWIEPSVGAWEWLDSRERTERVLLLDLSPRFLLEFLPGRNWVFTLKSRYEHDFFNSHSSLFVRPGLTYFLMRDREPRLNFSLNYGLYFPLNFGDALLYEHEPYLTVLYHLNRWTKLELSAAFKNVTWSSSADALANGTPYTVTYRALVVGLGVLFPVQF